MYFDKVYFNENGNATEVLIICDKCGKIISISDMQVFDKITSDYCILNKKIKCDCGNENIEGLIEPRKLQNLKESTIKIPSSTSNTPHCPTCGSTDIKKITTTAKATNTIMFGLLGTKRHKIFHCNNCKYEW